MLHIFYVICKCEQKMSYNIDIPKISRSMELFTLYLPICHLLFHPPLCIPEWVVQTTNVYKSIRSNILWPKRWKCSILWIHTIWSHAFSKSVLCTSKLYLFMYSWFRMSLYFWCYEFDWYYSVTSQFTFFGTRNFPWIWNPWIENMKSHKP